MQLVDSHCHIDFSPLREDLPGLLSRARDNGLGYLLCVAVNLEDFPRIAKLAAAHRDLQPRIFASVGVHPNHQTEHEPDADELFALADNPDVVAIGETGLDYFRGEETAWQKSRFEAHINAAKASQKPLIIHTRAAADDTMDMLENLDAQAAGGVMHCFAEDWATAKRALDIGFYLSFSGLVTFKNAASVQEVAKKAPTDRILVETDAPYLAPVPLRGKTCEPSFVLHTAKFLAQLRDTTLAQIAATTTENFFALFGAAKR